jgi:hypothetical protein
MKKLIILFAASLLFSFSFTKPPITDKERNYAIDLLTKTEQGVFKSLVGLSDAQLNFKAAPDRWSIADCVKHIAVSEGGLWQMTDAALKAAANPEKRSAIKATDDQVVTMLESRAQKVKTIAPLEPQNTPYKSLTDAIASFYVEQEKLIEFVRTTNDDLRDHVVTFTPGSFDSYQMVLFIAAHNNRHTQQIEEVKADPNYPKN